MKMATMLKIYQ